MGYVQWGAVNNSDLHGTCTVHWHTGFDYLNILNDHTSVLVYTYISLWKHLGFFNSSLVISVACLLCMWHVTNFKGCFQIATKKWRSFSILLIFLQKAYKLWCFDLPLWEFLGCMVTVEMSVGRSASSLTSLSTTLWSKMEQPLKFVTCHVHNRHATEMMVDVTQMYNSST